MKDVGSEDMEAGVVLALDVRGGGPVLEVAEEPR